MNATFTRGRFLLALLFVVAVLQFAVSRPAEATIMYNNPGPFVGPVSNPGLAGPAQVYGKEYSHDPDQSAAPPGGGIDPAQVIAWDGLGGTADGFDYSLPAPPFATSGIFEVDALANTHDALFKSLLRMVDGQVVMPDRTHLVFSIDDAAHTSLPFGLMPTSIPAAGPVATLANVLGGAGEISFERGGAFSPPNVQGLWANQLQINGMPTPRDLDGLEIWGPDPRVLPLGSSAAAWADSDKYSVDVDVSTGGPAAGPFSVWDYDPVTGSTPYVSHADVVAVVRAALGEPNFPHDLINLDALMVQDDVGSPLRFDPGDKIIFSIRQVPATFAADMSGFLSTGSEIFWMDGATTPAAPVGNFLFHGGHLWNKAYALMHMTTTRFVPGIGQVVIQLDLDALEAVSTPEPTAALLMLVGATALGTIRRRQA